MDHAKKNARGQGGRNQEHEEERIPRTHHAETQPLGEPALDEMARYVKAGLQLIPLHRWDARDEFDRPRGKTPRDGAWQRRQYAPETVLAEARRSGLNVGVRLPTDVVVLDVDPRHFPAGRDCLAELAGAFGIDLSLAPHTVTGGGGHHYWFRKPADVQLLDSLKDYPGVEFKSLGRQVVAAGSVHPNGRHYEWDELSPSFTELPELPARVLEAARRPDRTTAHREAGELTPQQLEGALEHLDPEDFRDHDRWRDLMMACHHATNGEGRQEFIEWSTQDPEYADHAWIIGNRWDSLHTEAPHGRPVTARLLHKLVQEAGGQVPNPEPEDDFEPWEDDGEPPPRSRRWRFLSIDELEALPPPRWLIPGLLTEGSLAAIYGAPESGKSFLAVDMSMAIAGGMDWHGRGVERGAVLYIAAEGAPGLGKRVRAWKVERGAQGRPFDFQLMRDEINLAAEKDNDVRAFVAAVTEALGPLRLIVIDTLNQTAAGADENSAKDMSRYIASMKRLRDATGATVAVVHHSGKDESKGMRGSTALLGAMDTTIEVKRSGDGRSVDVIVRKQKDAEREIPMRFNLEKVADSLVLRPAVMADAADGFRGQSDSIVELACEMAEERGGSYARKALVAAVMERDSSSEATARRRVEKSMGEGRENAVAALDGTLVWLERADSNPRGEMVVRTARVT